MFIYIYKFTRIIKINMKYTILSKMYLNVLCMGKCTLPIKHWDRYNLSILYLINNFFIVESFLLECILILWNIFNMFSCFYILN